MKSLYESILSSTNSGKKMQESEVEKWLRSTNWFLTSPFGSDVKKIDVTALRDGTFDVNFISHTYKTKNINLEKIDTKNTGKLPYNISVFRCNGEPINVNYKNLKFKDSSEWVKEVAKDEGFINFQGCEIDKIDKLPKNCIDLYCTYVHRLGGGGPTTVKEISDIKIRNLSQGGVGRDGLSCNLNNIKNIKVTGIIDLSDSMLGYYALLKGNRRFTAQANQALTNFFKNNDVKPEQCVLYIDWKHADTKYKKGKIVFDKKSDEWRFKGEKE